MRRFFIENITFPVCKLTGNENKHLSEVLRAKSGDRIILCNGDGKDYIYEIVGFSRSETSLKFIESEDNKSEPRLDLTVYFALLKGDKSELVVQKLTELGVKHIVPFISKYCVSRPDKTDRLVRSAVEACKQCGRAVVPTISDIKQVGSIVKDFDQFDKVVFAYEKISKSQSTLSELLSGKESKVALVIGPEGGFSDEEYEMIISSGVKPVSLGNRILRAETASIAAAAVIFSMEGDW